MCNCAPLLAVPVSTYDKAKLFAENPILDDSGILLLAFPLRINPKQHNIPVTQYSCIPVTKKVIAKFGSSKVSGRDCIPVVVPKNCEP